MNPKPRLPRAEPPVTNGGMRSKPWGAGEGGRLPRGLSLFRFFLFSALMLGAAYGGAALYFGSPPPPGYASAGAPPARAWSPSPIWLPVFVCLHARVGVEETEGGYAFRGPAGRALFGSAAIGFGILCGGAVGWVVGEQVRRQAVRRKEKR